MKKVLLLIVLLSVVGVDARKPNVLFIFIDDQGYHDLSCYGATEVDTPNIDALAKNGARFINFYSAAPICSPSRAGLVTGCYPRRTKNEVWVHRPDSKEGLPTEITTMGELFKNEGYATACIGKWHLGFTEDALPKNHGYDHYYGILHNLDSFETVQFENEGGMPFWEGGKIVRRDVPPGKLTRLYTDHAIEWMTQLVEAEQPFFCYLPHTMLHDPLGVSPEFVGSSGWKTQQEYGDAIQEMDFNVGRLLDALKKLEVAEDTIVVYASDNGRWPGRNENQPLRGSKLTTLEGGFRVPGIVAGPGVKSGLEPGAVCHAMDWYPTLASLSGIKIPDGVILDGRDLSAMLNGTYDGIPPFENSVSLNAAVPLRRHFELDQEWSESFTQDEYLNAFFYHGSQGALAAVRSGKWKLNLHPNLMLYDLENDPGETILVNDWGVKTKLRGMVVRFQREMNEQ